MLLSNIFSPRGRTPLKGRIAAECHADYETLALAVLSNQFDPHFHGDAGLGDGDGLALYLDGSAAGSGAPKIPVHDVAVVECPAHAMREVTDRYALSAQKQESDSPPR
jgi:hypothetical protein